jgi:hypothetical protein
MKVHFSISDELPYLIYSDRDRIEYVVKSLIKNSIERSIENSIGEMQCIFYITDDVEALMNFLQLSQEEQLEIGSYLVCEI